MSENLRKLLEDEFAACAGALAESHRQMEAFWDSPATIELAVRAFYPPEKKTALPYSGSPIEEYLHGQLFNNIKPRLERRHYGFVDAPVLRPSISLYPDLWHSRFIAAVMGARIVGPAGVAKNEMSPETSWCQPFLSSPAEVDKLIGLDIMSNPSFVAYLRDLGTIRDITGGAIPIEIMCGVGPVDVATDVLGYQGFLEGLYTHPQQMHKILDLCTDYWLQIIQAQIDAAGWAKNKWAAPGQTASEMIGPQVSIEQIREFFMPVRRRIAKKYGRYFATFNHPDVNALDLRMELDGCRAGFLGNDYPWPADYVVPRMSGKAVAVSVFNLDPNHMPCRSWDQHMERFRTFAGRIKMLVVLTGIMPPGAEKTALQCLHDLQQAWAGVVTEKPEYQATVKGKNSE